MFDFLGLGDMCVSKVFFVVYKLFIFKLYGCVIKFEMIWFVDC